MSKLKCIHLFSGVGAPTEQRLEINPNGTANTLTTVQKDNYVVEKVVNVGDNYIQWDTSGKGYNSQQDRAYYIDGTGPALSACNTSGSKSQVINVSKEEAKEIFEAKVMQVGNVTDTTNCSWDNPQRGRMYNSDGISPTLNCMQGGGLEPKIIEEPQIDKVDIPQPVTVRKYPVDTVKLQSVLKEHKKYSNKELADKLGIPQTKVEHWFRTDSYFAIPDPEYWYILKELLEIKTDEFDQAITTFEEKEGTYEKSNRCYKDSGIAPTLTTVSADEKVIIGSTQKHAAVNTDGVVPTLTSAMGEGGGHIPMHNYDIRIRKLTPRECWRLMDFTDEDFDKAQSVGISNSQLYKIAGNSIVVNVLYHIFRRLFIDFDKED